MTRSTSTNEESLRRILQAIGGRLGLPREPCALRAVCRGLFYAMLSLLVLFDLLSTALKAGQALASGRLTSGATPLDSFSEAAIAAALLRHKAEASLQDYVERRNERELPRATGSPGRAVVNAKDGLLASPEKPPQTESDRLRSIEQLHATVRELDWDLDQKLLLVYWTSQRSGEFLGLFIQMLQVCPERADVLSWLAPALECARRLGRADELEDSLHHTIRFHGKSKTVSELKARFDAWNSSAEFNGAHGER